MSLKCLQKTQRNPGTYGIIEKTIQNKLSKRTGRHYI